MRRLRDPLVITFQAVVIVTSLAAALWIRFEFLFGEVQWALLTSALVVAVPIKLVTFFVGGLHRDSWRHAGLQDLSRIGLVNVCASVLSWIAITYWFVPGFPRSVYIIDLLLCFLLNAGARYSIRLYNETVRAELAKGKGVLIYGAGAAGRTLLREVRANRSLGLQVVGFIDDNPSIRSMRIMDVAVLGGGRDIARIVDRHRHRNVGIQEVIIAMPSA